MIIGVGQYTLRDKIDHNKVSSIVLAQKAIETSVEDTGQREILEYVDSLSVVDMFSEEDVSQAEKLCKHIGITPVFFEDTTIGGNTPQWLINKTADKIMRGDCKVAVLAGAENFYRKASRYQFNLKDLDDRVNKLSALPTAVGDNRNGTSTYEQFYGLTLPHRIYPLFENALRYHLKLTPEEYRIYLKSYYDNLSSVAKDNPYAWFNGGSSSESIVSISDNNPLFNYPYTKHMNPNPFVNQGCALIMTDTETAKDLGVAEDKWVYLHGGADAADRWYVSERINYYSSPAINLIVDAALSQAGILRDDIDFYDLYSCFPCAALIAANEIGLPLSPLPNISITGGLSFFGAPGSNYTMHAIANAVVRLRSNPGEFGLISGLGWYITKHAVGVYSRRKPKKEWLIKSSESLQAKINAMEAPKLTQSPRGYATIETYTVLNEGSLNPPFSIIVARDESGGRFLATTSRETSEAMLSDNMEFIGQRGRVSQSSDGKNVFRFI